MQPESIGTVSRHRKATYFKVGLNKADAAALRELARRESQNRQDPELGGATLLREYAMPLVHVRLAELRDAEQRGIEPPAEREQVERGPERRREPAAASR